MNDRTFPFEVVTTTLVAAEGKGVICTSGKVSASGASAAMIGVIRKGAAVGDLADIALPGDVCPVLLTSAVTRGDTLCVDSSSTFAKSTPSDGDIVAAIALESGIAGAMADALICKAHRHEAG
jgi:hypothetical protein